MESKPKFKNFTNPDLEKAKRIVDAICDYFDSSPEFIFGGERGSRDRVRSFQRVFVSHFLGEMTSLPPYRIGGLYAEEGLRGYDHSLFAYHLKMLEGWKFSYQQTKKDPNGAMYALNDLTKILKQLN